MFTSASSISLLQQQQTTLVLRYLTTTLITRTAMSTCSASTLVLPSPVSLQEKISFLNPSSTARFKNGFYSKSRGGVCCMSVSSVGSRATVDDGLFLDYKPTTAFLFPGQVETLLDSVKWDDKGLAVAIAQNVDTGAILMQGFANREALATTIQSRKATFYSRSRSSLWTKGETSNNFINVHDIFLDCDRDSIIYLGKPDGPTCHTGSDTCYYLSVFDFLRNPETKENRLAKTTLYELESTISQRKAQIGVENGKPSWTQRLLLDDKLLCSKIREEAGELCQTLEGNEDKSRAAAEAGDLLFHSMVLLNNKGVQMEEVLEVLRRRFSQSGIEEKNSRKLQAKD